MENNKNDNEGLYSILVVLARKGKELPTYENLRKYADSVKGYFNLTDEEIEKEIIRFQINEGISKGTASFISEDNDPEWINDLISDVDNNFPTLNRYITYLQEVEHFSENVALTIRNETIDTIKYFANPKIMDRVVLKRGMVVGDVQSGKTSNYIAVINAAIDIGYENIIVLAGLTESLRQQTQIRIDEGVVGADSNSFTGQIGKINHIGIGSRKNEHYALSFTNREKDFVTSVADAMRTTGEDVNKPRIFVIKKNSTSLTKLANYIKEGSIEHGAKMHSLLVIDDECDNASINTKTDDDPTRYNGLIRSLLTIFKTTTYVGYTATPYSNIFINPDGENSQHMEDLFPKDFIGLLENPTNYFGYSKCFARWDEDENIRCSHSFGPHLYLLDENEPNYLKSDHKKDVEFYTIPQSLKVAIGTFLISNVVRTLKGDGKKHRSMLVNISRFNSLHDRIAANIEEYVRILNNAIVQKYNYDVETFVKNKECKMLFDIWNTEEVFSNDIKCENGELTKEKYPWHIIQKHLKEEIEQFKVAVINSSHKKDRFDYDRDAPNGARVIVVGGFTLSRGLTLKGLMTSYYSRRASAYDVLLQMGRWFGYRYNFGELCMLFMTKINVYCFDAAALSTEELKGEFRTMHERDDITPMEFGLKVKEKPDTLKTNLLITARNKMKNSEKRVVYTNLSSQVVQTSRIFKDQERNRFNFSLMEKLITRSLENGCKFVKSEVDSTYEYLHNVPRELIVDFLVKYKTPLQNTTYDAETICKVINEKETLNKWDVVIAEGNKSGDPIINISGKPVKLGFRSIASVADRDYFTTSAIQNNLSNPGMFRIGLSKSAYESIKEQHGSNPGAKAYLQVDRLPLLVLVPLHLKAAKNDEETLEIIDELSDVVPVGISLGFPGKTGSTWAVYSLNKIALSLLEEGNDADEDEEVEE